MQPAALVTVENVDRSFGSVTAVRDLSFSLHSGEVLGFLGPNGAGKSTTMRLITGNLPASAGTITIGGYDLQQDPVPARRLFGYLPDTPPLYRDCTVREFLHFCGKLHGLGRQQLPQAVDRCVERCGLGDVGNKLIAHLSKGFQQRVGIAQAIVHDPELIILDEPTVGLDPRQIDEIRQLIRELGRSHSLLMSTHILSEVQAVCSHLLIINKGERVLHSALADLDQTEVQMRYRAAFNRPPDSDQLARLAGVGPVSPDEQGGYQIEFSERQTGIDALLSASLEQNWQLTELAPIHPSLEQLFLQITDAPASTATADPPAP